MSHDKSKTKSSLRVNLYSAPLRVGRAFKLEVLNADHTPELPSFRTIYVPISTCHEIHSEEPYYIMVESWMCSQKGI